MTKKLSDKQRLLAFEEGVYNPLRSAIRERSWVKDVTYWARLDHALDLVHTHLREQAIGEGLGDRELAGTGDHASQR